MRYKVNVVSDNIDKSKELVTKVFLNLYLKHKNDDWYLDALKKQEVKTV